MSLIPVDKFKSSIILRGPNKPFLKVLPLPKILRLPAASAMVASRVCAMFDKLSPALIAGAIVRHGLTMAAGALVAHGVITADFAKSAIDQMAEPMTGIAIGVAAVVWSLAQKWRAAR